MCLQRGVKRYQDRSKKQIEKISWFGELKDEFDERRWARRTFPHGNHK